ncbi:MAG: methyltransferase domain-containing protein [Bacteroidota bacterium]
MFNSFKTRSEEAEIIDDFSLEGEAIEATYKSIEGVNTWLGGNLVLINSLKKVVQGLRPTKALIQLADLGCGSGDGMAALALWAKKRNINITFTGYDANPFVVLLAQQNGAKHPNIKVRKADIFTADCDLSEVDIATFNLCLHHFTDREIQQLLEKCKAAGVQTIIINDLHRHWLAYRLFSLVCFIFRVPEIPRKDGLLSIKKGFKRQELQNMAQSIGSYKYDLKWKWAFRFQLLIFLNYS